MNQVLTVLKIIYDKFLISLFIILVGFIIGKAIGKIIENFFKGFEINRLLKKVSSSIAFDKAIGQLSSYAVYIITVIFVLQVIGIKNLVFTIILIILSVLIVLSLIAAISTIIPNMFVGFFIKKKIRKGQNIRFGSVKGKILKIRFSDVMIKSSTGDVFSVPYIYIKKKIK